MPREAECGSDDKSSEYIGFMYIMCIKLLQSAVGQRSLHNYLWSPGQASDSFVIQARGGIIEPSFLGSSIEPATTYRTIITFTTDELSTYNEHGNTMHVDCLQNTKQSTSPYPPSVYSSSESKPTYLVGVGGL